MLFERAGGGEGMPTRVTGMGATCLGWRWWWGYRRRYASERSSRKPTRWRLRCALIRPCCWHWRPCIGAAGGGSSAVDCVGGEAIVMSVDGLSASLQQREERQEATQWRLGYQDQLIEHRQERRHAPGGRSKGSGSSSWRPRPPRLDSHSRRHRFICAQRSP